MQADDGEREIEGSLRNRRQGYFPIIQPFSAIPEGKLWSAREAKRKSHSFISIRGPLLFFLPDLWSQHTVAEHTHTHRVAKGNRRTLGGLRISQRYIGLQKVLKST